MPKLKEIIGEELFKQLPEDKQKEFKDKDFEDTSNGAFIPKQRFDQVNEQAKEYKKQVGERDKQLNDLQGKVKDNEELTKEIDNLKANNTKTTQEYEDKIKKLQFDTVLNSALKNANAKDSKLIRALLDESKLTVDGDNVIGLKDQLDVIQKERDYLFEKEIPGTGTFTPGGGEEPGKGQKLELGERLAKEKSEQMKASETLNNFFK